MSAITTRPRLISAAPSAQRAPEVVPGEKRIMIRGLSWELYDRLSDAIGEGQYVRLAFDGSNLEIMTTGPLHEDVKDLLARLVNAVTMELDIPCKGAGGTTWKRPDLTRGLAADQCYYFAPAKLAAVAEARARKSNDVADYPNPDLAIEVDLSPPEIDRAGIYAALKVVEVWRFDGESLVIEHLQQNGEYIAAESSQFLPIRANEVLYWVAAEDSANETAWERRLRAWIRDELAGRGPDRASD